MGRKREPSPDEGRPKRVTAMTIRASEEWKGWLDRLARHCRLTTSTVVDQAVVRYAREMGFEEPPPER